MTSIAVKPEPWSRKGTTDATRFYLDSQVQQVTVSLSGSSGSYHCCSPLLGCSLNLGCVADVLIGGGTL